VLVFSVAVWVFIFISISGFVYLWEDSPHVKLERVLCRCGQHSYYYLRFKELLLGSIITALVFSYPLHRLMLIFYTKPDAGKLPLSWMARLGRSFCGIKGIPVVLLIIIAYFTANHFKRNKYPDRGGNNTLKITRLHCAAGKGDIKSVERELEAGVNVDVRGSKAQTPLQVAIEKGHETIVFLLIEKGADIASKDIYGVTLLHGVARCRDIRVAKYLVENGLDVNAIGPNKYRPIHWCLRRENILKLLIENGADINVKDFRGCTPLHHAVGQRNICAIEILIAEGADVNARDNNGITPIDMGYRGIHMQETLDLLRAHGGKTGEEIRKQENKKTREQENMETSK
jgi:hypothetical protein